MDVKGTAAKFLLLKLSRGKCYYTCYDGRSRCSWSKTKLTKANTSLLSNTGSCGDECKNDAMKELELMF